MGRVRKNSSRRESKYLSITGNNLESQSELREIGFNTIRNKSFAMSQKKFMDFTNKKRLLKSLVVQNAIKEKRSNNQTLYSEPSIEESMKCLTVEYVIDNQKHSFKIPVKDIDKAFKQAFPNL